MTAKQSPAPLFTLRRPGQIEIPPGTSPALAAMLLAIELCQRPDQLAAWWDWPAHREARWHLSAEEQAEAKAAADRRLDALAARAA